MRLLLSDDPVRSCVPLGSELDLDALARLLGVPPDAPTWLRVNMISTLDGAAVGADGRSGTINNPADQIVFDLLRAISDVVVIGAGTARIEGYPPLRLEAPYAALRRSLGRPDPLPLAVVTASGELPDRLLAADDSAPVLVVTHAATPHLGTLRSALGTEQVLVTGQTSVDLAAGLAGLHERGLTRVHSEGGPSLLGDLLHAGLVDELDLTWAPLTVGSHAFRIVQSAPHQIDWRPVLLVEQDGTVMARYLRHPADREA